ncbi:LLM class flavin-dependent oxidoreductase [Porticoccus sp. W117]|uniref:MupA/Atu3671 family FMN-dependent luciferase-like monooxygenase n=1 Tax=Porticoccus sp. W117 TaxID=3054777 RepID=UPI00259627CD|nr:MupA/Atu3671 family FMN-dependent luciferase-like monooxygenase [Porticoccus sp. W117]MDM3870605.1 LLM class flavin-dependent oxidoreductase [Porticoccus sp. W117]
MSKQPFDYLFSITHLEMISESVLALPKQLAINFHDGPLPRYAGLNTPAWALMNGESEYGISWHVMAPGVDQGDLLKQQMFGVSANETSLSINTKCFAAALESFPKLVNELVSGTVQCTAQDLSKRSYFGKYQRPAGAGVLDWQRSAQVLEAQIRALDFGSYLNSLNCAKAVIGSQIFVVASATAVDVEATSAVGTVLAISDESIQVACSQGALSLTGFSSVGGEELSPAQVAEQCRLEPGCVLAVPNMDALDSVNAKCSRAEAFWLNRLVSLESTPAPYASEVSSHQAANSQSLAIDVPAGLVAGDARDYAIAAFVLLLGRLAGREQVDIAFSNEQLRADALIAPGLMSANSILRATAESNGSCHQLIERVGREMSETASQGSWLHEVAVRYPELRTAAELKLPGLLPVGVSVGNDGADVVLEQGRVLTLLCTSSGRVHLAYDENRLASDMASKLAGQLAALINSMAANPEQLVASLELLSQEEKNRVLVEWNDTEASYDKTACVHQLFEQQVQRKPEAAALVFEDKELSYSELNQRANQLAHHLMALGVGPDTMVGVHIERSLDLMVATLGVMKAGGAYVPLDPAFPADRIRFMIEDSAMPVILTQSAIESQLPAHQAKTISIDSDWPQIAGCPATAPAVDITSSNLAYVIYTSGSTGKPKGVMVEHRNAVNFFVGMDRVIPHDDNSTWLAVTSLSFDISVLELFWTLTRGLKVVIYLDRDKKLSMPDASSVPISVSGRPMSFGLFMWGNDDGPGEAKYRLMMEGSKYFDENGFNAVWTPERHFGAFGGPYPNPAVTSAAIAAVTKNISIRSGSCVSPLHHPIRIAEDWAVVDNLSNGRVALSFAAGWQPNDFVIKPENHKNNKQVMMEQIETVKKLWRGEKVAFENPMGQMVDIETLPRPVQKELPVWFTTAGNPESYRQAGELGVNVLTHLLGQSVEELAEKVKIYREARAKAGHDPAAGKVSLMLHTLVGDNTDEVRELVRQPMKDYLSSAMKLVLDFAWAFPAFKRPGGADSNPEDIDIKNLSAEDTDAILEFAFERYFETSGLFGDVATCEAMINRCKAADIDEIACLMDFGVDTNVVMDSLPLLKQVRDLTNPSVDTKNATADQSLAAQIRRHGVTHFQCTPSMARMLTFDDDAKQALGEIDYMMVGGEALPTSLAQELNGIVKRRVTNMYGPTETTIWSTTQVIGDTESVAIGRPIANTQIYILDEHRRPVPPGVPGDLFIGGDGVVRGYLNRPDLTSERFITNPFMEQGTIYWTGDMARYQEDGVIDFLGRVDHQVKIRGYRIELGEIETRIGQYAGVRENVMLLREDSPGDQRLVAYLMVGDPAFDIAALKSHLREKLPEYMVPNDVVILDAFPQTPNGKIDRKALPSPQSLQKAQVAEYVAPEDGIEKTIAKVWQETLQLDKVGINDNFFDLGGHSLLIVKVHSQLKAELDQPVSLTDLYRCPTIKSLTAFLNTDGAGESMKKSSDRAQRRRAMMGGRRRRAR